MSGFHNEVKNILPKSMLSTNIIDRVIRQYINKTRKPYTGVLGSSPSTHFGGSYGGGGGGGLLHGSRTEKIANHGSGK